MSLDEALYEVFKTNRHLFVYESEIESLLLICRPKVVEDKVEDLPPSSSMLVGDSSTTKYVRLTTSACRYPAGLCGHFVPSF